MTQVRNKGRHFKSLFESSTALVVIESTGVDCVGPACVIQQTSDIAEGGIGLSIDTAGAIGRRGKLQHGGGVHREHFVPAGVMYPSVEGEVNGLYVWGAARLYLHRSRSGTNKLLVNAKLKVASRKVPEIHAERIGNR